MKTLKLGIIGTVLAGALASPWLVRHHAEVRWRAQQQALLRQAAVLDQLSAENARLSNMIVQAESSQSLSNAQLASLTKSRNEFGQLQQTLQEIEQLRRQIQRLRDRLQDAAREEQEGHDDYTALLADEMPRRQARVARLRQWLDEMPGEKIPELQFLSEDDWIRVVDDPLVTDDDYRSAASRLRADADLEFGRRALPALQQYVQVNNGQFPTDLSQLNPYFESPIDDAILQRYEIVPTNSVVSSLANLGGDELITEKAPINKELDLRTGIGTNQWRNSMEEGVWDPVK
ncbi:MAG: hypothetical protein ABSD58_07335 [Verrucomicrobiia bacterium]|jgi:hypothetical protein